MLSSFECSRTHVAHVTIIFVEHGGISENNAIALVVWKNDPRRENDLLARYFTVASVPRVDIFDAPKLCRYPT